MPNPDRKEISPAATVAVAGSGGRLGAAIARRFEALGHRVLRFDRHTLDLGDIPGMKATLAGNRFDVLVNCAALTNVDYCERHRDEAFAVNADAPAAMAEACAAQGARFVHVGTDYVYAGDEPGARSEDDPAEPRSEYGRSKLEGDRRVAATDPSFYVVRTSWVFGPDRPSFLDTMLERSLRGEPVAAISDKYSSPCYSEDFAELLRPLLGPGVGGGGVVNLCNSGTCSWQEYAQLGIDAATACGVEMPTRQVEPISLADMPQFVAPRPVHTAMDTSRFTRLTGRRPRPWQDAVRAYIESSWAPPHLPLGTVSGTHSHPGQA